MPLPTAFLTAMGHLLSPKQWKVGVGDRLAYERDGNQLHTRLPLGIAFPESTGQVQAIMRLCHAYRVAVTPWGAGTSQSGGAVAAPEAIHISFARMNRLLVLDVIQRWALVEPGLRNGALNELVAPYGLQFAPDPSSQLVATVGGNVASNAGGIHGRAYGVTRDHILGAELVLANGESLILGGPQRAARTPLALDLAQGSEGTLALLTKVWVRLQPKASQRLAGLLIFSSVEAACACVSELRRQDIPTAALELMDALTLQTVNKAFQAGFPEAGKAALLIELEAHDEKTLLYYKKQLQALLETRTPLSVELATEPEAVARLWKARRGAAASYGLVTPAFYVLDCVIPCSKLAFALRQIEAIGEQFALQIANVFHAGDGNLHPHLFFDPSNNEQKQRVLLAAEAIYRLALSLGGTLSGEHGIGLEKKQWLDWEFSAGDIKRFHWLQQAFDPEHLLNPDKRLPTAGCCGAERYPVSCVDNLQGYKPQALASQGLWI